MQRKWRRAWLRGKPHYMRHKPVRKARTGSIKSKVYSLTAKAAKKLAPAAAAAGILLSTMTGVQANPAGGNIAAGTGSITGQGTSNVTINQTSDKLAINWNSFNIGSGEKVQFIQPGASSIALNRVLGNNASSIYGQLSANGKVFLINPNGVLFAKGAQVNVSGLVASTLNLSDKDFMSGKYTFSGDSQNGVLNQGNITAANGGYVALLGANAANEGVILAKEGTAALGAGSKVSLDFTGDGLLTLSVDESKVKAEVKNSGLIKADGGLVVMNAKAADALTGSVVNNTGTVEAKSVTSKNGAIILTGDTVTNAGALDASGKGKGETGGTVKVLGDTVRLASGSSIDVSGDTGGGTALVGGAYQGGNSEYAATKTAVEQGTSINADALTTGNGGQVVVWANDTTSFAGSISAKGGKNSGDGGSVETSGHKNLTVDDNASVNTKAANGKTGNWLLDPVDITIGTGGDIEAGTLETALGSSNVTITTGNTTGTMTSSTSTYGHGGSGDITVNENVSWHNTNSLTLSAYCNININALIVNTSTDGAAVTLRADNTGTGIGTVSFAADGSGTISTNGKVNIYYNPTSKVSATIGGDTVDVNSYNYKMDYSRFVYKADGATFSTPNAYMLINNVYDLQYIGTNSTTLGGIYALGANIDASATKNWNGGAGFVPIGNYDTRFTGSFDGGGHTIAGLMINRPTTDYVGLFGYANSNPIANISLVNASIKGQKWIGSLAGLSYGQIINACATGSVTGSSNNVGGLVGQNKGSISNSYATGSVNGIMSVGGLVGENQNNGSISNCYATGRVEGAMYVGGLVGSNSSNGGQIATIGNSYATGGVTVYNSVAGGLVGSNNGNIASSYATGKVVDRNTTGGLVGNNYGSGSITNSYWDANTTGKDVGVGEDTSSGTSTYTALYSSTGGTGTAFTKGSYSWFDASGNSTDWYMVEGSTRPFLRSEYSTTITNAHQLQLMAMDLTKNYTLANNIDMGELTSASGMWRTASTADGSGNYGFTPIGNGTTNFKGTFDGGGHTISGLTIHSNVDYVGLFGYADSSSKISNIGLVGGSVTGTGTNAPSVGALAGGNYGSITNSYNTASVTGTGNFSYVGGLAGYNGGSITNSYNTGSVTGTGNVPSVGGLVGWNTGNITSSYNAGKVTAKGLFGGLVGQQGAGGIEGSYWDINSTGQAKGVGNKANDAAHYTGLTSDQMKKAGNFSGWADLKDSNGNNVWYFYDGYTAPYLRSFLTPLTVSADSVTKVYDGSAATAVTNKKYTPSTGIYDNNMVAGDLVWSGGGNVGSYGLHGLYTTSQQGYLISYDPNAKLTITPRQLTATATAQNKVYNGNYNATVTGVSFGNFADGESLTAKYTGGTYETKDAGSGIKVTVNGVTMTADNPATLTTNYLLPTEVTTTSDITPRQLTATATAQNKVYDGNDSATVTGVTFGNFADGESLTAKYTGGTYETKDAHNGIKVTVNGVTMTADNVATSTNNYLLPTEVTTTADISKRQLTATATAQNKVYDGNHSATVTGVTFGNLADGESLTAKYTGGTYETKDAHNGIKVTVNGVGMTADNVATSTNNYLLPTEVTTTADISKRQLTATATVQNKVYDGNYNATVTGVSFGNFADGESLTAKYTGGTYETKDAHNGIKVTVNGVGMTADNAATSTNNYLLPTEVITTADISRRQLTATASVQNKVYDGNYNATVTGVTFGNFADGESLTAKYTGGTYETKDAHNGIKVTVNGVTMTADNVATSTNNYLLPTEVTTTADISKRQLTATATAQNKVYDGNHNATVTGVIFGNLADGESLTAKYTGGTYETKDAHNGIKVTVNGVGMTADNAATSTNNYLLPTEVTTTADISKRQLTATASVQNKVYDGKTDATVDSVTFGNFVDGETLTAGYTGGAFSDKHAGDNKAVTVSGLTMTARANTLADNYLLPTTVTSNASITPAALTITAITNTKTYDGMNTANATPTYNSNDVKTGDKLTVSETYDNKNAGTDKTLTVNYVMDDGNGGKNYSITTKTATGTITPKDLTITAITNNKIYDGTNTANAKPTYNSNDVQTGDTLTVSETYDNKNAGTDKTLTVNYIMDDGNGGKNYNVTTKTATGTITPKDLTITAVTNTKTYDGTNTANATPTYNSNDVKTGDKLTVSETYDNKNAGTDKILTVSYVMDDGNGGKNYNVTTQTATGTINKAALTVTANDDAKIYDKTAYAGGNKVTYDGFVNGENKDVLGGSLTYSGTSQGATEIGSYTITPAGLTSTNYTITFKDGTLTIKPAAITDPGYIAAVKNAQQNTGDTTAGTGEPSTYPPAAKAASTQMPAGQVSPIQYSSDTTGTPRVITTTGQTVTIAQDSLLQLATNPVQREIAVYQTINGSTALAGAYHVDSSQGSLALRESATSFAPVSQERPASAYAQAETSSFQLTDSQGNTANFIIAYTGGNLYVQVTNAAAADMLSQNRQLITATALVAAQDKLSIDINNLQAVYLEK